MYGDHHVIEVRRLLLSLPGVETVYASSSFRLVEVEFDPAKVTEQDLLATLEAAGYLGDWLVPVEPGEASVRQRDGNGAGHFRHTAVYEQTRQNVSFTHATSFVHRPLWPCPGMGTLNSTDEEN
jgi:hypothetical protein